MHQLFDECLELARECGMQQEKEMYCDLFEESRAAQPLRVLVMGSLGMMRYQSALRRLLEEPEMEIGQEPVVLRRENEEFTILSPTGAAQPDSRVVHRHDRLVYLTAAPQGLSVSEQEQIAALGELSPHVVLLGMDQLEEDERQDYLLYAERALKNMGLDMKSCQMVSREEMDGAGKTMMERLHAADRAQLLQEHRECALTALATELLTQLRAQLDQAEKSTAAAGTKINAERVLAQMQLDVVQDERELVRFFDSIIAERTEPFIDRMMTKIRQTPYMLEKPESMYQMMSECMTDCVEEFIPAVKRHFSMRMAMWNALCGKMIVDTGDGQEDGRQAQQLREQIGQPDALRTDSLMQCILAPYPVVLVALVKLIVYVKAMLEKPEKSSLRSEFKEIWQTYCGQVRERLMQTVAELGKEGMQPFEQYLSGVQGGAAQDKHGEIRTRIEACEAMLQRVLEAQA